MLGDKRKMKDEEMADESLISYRKEPKWAGKIFMQDENTCYKDGFLAGLKAGRPQWHDLRKDPNDLPKEYDIIRKAFGIYEEEKAKHIVQNECGERVFCFSGTWYHEKGGEAHPIAWCEIPTFDKE